MLLHRLQSDGLISPPKWLADNTQYVCYTGSTAYGASADTSDLDCYGWAFPPKDVVFPHTAGHILGFGNDPPAFNCYQEHHIVDKKSGKEYDFQIYSVVHYFNLLLQNNPNMVDSLFVPDRCVLHATKVGQLVREKRKLFLHKGAFHKFKGYAYAQLKKVRAKSSSASDKRQATIDAHGYDTKHAYHIVRLALECQEILETGDLHLDQNGAQYRAIRNGEWTLDRLEKWFEDKERHLENAYAESKLPHAAPEEEIKELLLNCLETHYGSLDKAVTRQTDIDKVLAEMRQVIERHGG